MADDVHWAVAPGTRWGWDWAASRRDPTTIKDDYDLWNVNWGEKWGWSPFRWSATMSARRHARLIRRRTTRRRSPKIIGTVGDEELEREFERIQKELARRKRL